MANGEVVLLGCGDVGPMHEPIGPYSTLARPVLATADIRFGQCERLYSEQGSIDPHGGGHSRLKPHMASVLDDCGFDVMSVASNHSLDFGAEALLDTIDLLHKKGIQTIGAGKNSTEARQPAVIERNGVRVAFLGYCSVIRDEYAAGPSKAGVAPMRARAEFKPAGYQPGVPPIVITTPYQEDVDAMIEDIRVARKMASAVVVSHHWGVHFIPKIVADYQRTVAQAAFDAGADLILGHHPHVPKAIGVHSNNKVCFYSLGNFIATRPQFTDEQARNFTRRFGLVADPDYPLAPYGPDAKRSLLAKAVFSAQGVKKVSFLPVIIDKKLRPEVLRAADPRFGKAVNYMNWASEGFDHTFAVEGDEAVITA